MVINMAEVRLRYRSHRTMLMGLESYPMMMGIMMLCRKALLRKVMV